MPTDASQTTDPAHDLLRAARKPALDVFFAPKSVAVIGATETVGSVGRTLVSNLLASPFGGTVYPVNPKRPAVLGVRAYPNIAAIPEPVELAVVCTPAPSVPGIIRECREAGVRGAIIISAGFKEAGEPGIELERQVLAEARQSGMRIVGPNCLGVMSPLTGMNATFAQAMAKPGKVAFLSQSGALLTAVLDHALKEGIGFSAFASLGSMLDVGWGDLLDYLGDDPNTQSIVIYMETVGDARSFLSAAREVSLSKPILVIKAGRTAVGAKAAASHTGSLTGSDDVLDVAFDRVGVLRVDSIADVYALTEALAKQPRPKGKRLTIVTNAGGPGVLATDALIGGGGELAPISDETMTALNGFLPTHWSHNNPVDVLGDAGAERYAKTLAIAADDSTSDGLLVVLTPQAMTAPTETAKLLSQYATSLGKPVLASWMGGVTVAAGEQILSEAGIPTFAYPDEAARVFNYLWRYADNLQSLYETPAGTKGESPAGANAAAEKLFDAVLSENRTLLTEYESKQLLNAYGIPTVETRVAATPDDAVREAESFGYPVVLKINSRTITHKTDVNGVQLNLKDADAVREAFAAIGAGVANAGHAATEFEGVTVQPMVKLSGYELILGASPDPQFGPVLLFGTGGQLVEVFGDRSLALPPLTTTLARRMMERTKIYTALLGVRGRPPVDMAALETLLVRFAALIAENPRIKEMDLNPLLVDHETMIALDARVVLYDKDETIARPAIRPYPAQYAASVSLKDGTTIPVRPIRADDEPRLVAFHQTLSDHTVALRYFEPLALDTRTAHERLARIAGTDYDREITLIALDAAERIVAVARLSKSHGVTVSTDSEARFTLLVSDEYQYRGLGTALLKQLIAVARAEGLARVVADVLAENDAMRRVCEKLEFAVGEAHGTPPVVSVTLSLSL